MLIWKCLSLTAEERSTKWRIILSLYSVVLMFMFGRVTLFLVELALEIASQEVISTLYCNSFIFFCFYTIFLPIKKKFYF